MLTGVDTGILDPRDTYADASEWEEKAKDLAGRFNQELRKIRRKRSWKSTRIRWTTVIKIIKIIQSSRFYINPGAFV